ncbi:MAG: autotransporter-associated beta strand repeat-containing protein [Pirellulales bacterium]
MRYSRRSFVQLAIALLSLSVGRASSADIVTWDATSTSWMTATSWSGDAFPTATDIGLFNSNSNPGSNLAGIDFGSPNVNNGAGNTAIGALESTRTSALTIRNTSTTTAGTLTLNGATVATTVGGGATSNVIVRHAGSTTWTLSNGTGSALAMEVALPNPTNVIAIDGAGTLVINSSIKGAGGIILMRNSGTARLDLGGVNSYEGDTVVDSGRARFRVADGTPHGSMAGDFYVNAGSQFGIDVSNEINGLNDGDDGGGIVDNDATTPQTLTIGDNNATSSFSGSIKNTSGTATAALSVTKKGNGTLTLSGDNSYIGATTINGGTLLVNGTHAGLAGSPQVSTAAADYAVNDTGTLGGIGTIEAVVVVNSGGTIAPGQSAGTFTVGGLTMTNSSFASFELENTSGAHSAGGASDYLDIVGLLNLSGVTTSFTLSVEDDAVDDAVLTAEGSWILASYNNLTAGSFDINTNVVVTGIGGGLSYALELIETGGTTGDLKLTTTAIPEANTFLAIGLVAVGTGFAGLVCRRRQVRADGGIAI